ncbi:MAG: heme lyase CcmF/NrfE family subunit [Alphaproteobacteria bacterium]|uniref:heme lyase CcmF/NrfE family subunit n=1 Tax=Brevundimonas sp. TaxID=1871086 RepID=UPI00184B6967|nr:heme lyase CcmF/NrfE family subunit [Brevundimonas sp.]MBA3050821.1 heme lyase CcmF/NrfE family subunit [Brevundimonas sp.]MBU3970949.1 heme lyase CcmF/NrfE family subunit [Alphaproteobacteria bacterium]MBU4039651.1 heme lyase CcmF/NrfE family subunit [Alphaproteobacteria bacterium]MBU4136132.1 heme lyase CcmF/NrfE family subunit [Alphaproteobacteria bacterium]
MIVELGSFALILGLALAVLQTAMAAAGRLRRSPVLAGAAEGAALAGAVSVALAAAALVWAFAVSDFSVANVAANSHTDKPMLYKVAAAWGSHEGSLLLWCLVLTGFGAVLSRARGLPFGLKTSAVGTQGLLGVLFLAFAVFTSNPFARLDPVPFQGNSLNPLLQDPALASHPPFLYAGYVGFSVCFSLAVAALIEGRANSSFWPAWGRWVRPWALASWSFLTIGITLGAFWAYYELGWGGWWFWDPVENASFMPWLAGTALLHSAVVTERRGALVGWTAFLALLAFTFSMLGAFLVRSGVLTSVHAFAVDPQRGMMLLAILGGTAGAAFALFAWRAPGLKGGGVFAPVSREGALVLNNLFLTAACATVLLGTLYPLILEAANGASISVGPPYFALTFTPLMAVAFLILPAGPLLAWKRGDMKGVAQRLSLAAGLALLVALLGWMAFEPRKALSAAGVGLGAWLILGTLAEVVERVRLFRAPLAESLRRARNLPLGAWGTTLAHAGLGVFVLGAVVETGYRVEAARLLAPGQTVEAGRWAVRLDSVRVVEGPNYLAEQGRLTVTLRDGGAARTITAERRFFPAGGQTTSEVGLDFRGLDDVYVVLGERGRNDAGAAGWTVRVWWNPWARLIFLGPEIMALGGLLSLLDRRLRLGVNRKTAA